MKLRKQLNKFLYNRSYPRHKQIYHMKTRFFPFLNISSNFDKKDISFDSCVITKINLKVTFLEQLFIVLPVLKI